MHHPKTDLDGKLISEIPSAEIERRLRNLRGDNHPTANQYRRAYEATLAERRA